MTRFLAGVFSPSECAALRQLQPVDAHHDEDGHGGDGHQVHAKPHRVDWLAERLNARIRDVFPDASVDPHVKVYEINVGEGVAPHVDSDFEADGRIARVSCLVYLSDGHEGGETRFIDGEQPPHGHLGDVLVFPHDRRHEGTPVTKGVRYVLKTDIFTEVARG